MEFTRVGGIPQSGLRLLVHSLGALGVCLTDGLGTSEPAEGHP